MGWPFEIINLSPEEKRMRRQVLDLYATYAHFSTLVPVLLFLLYRLSVWARRAAADSHGGAYGAVPTSPTLKVKRQTALGTWATWFRKLRWWLGDDVYVFGRLFCQRDQLVFGCLWFSWLLVLSVVDTHRDYIHLTKRFGIIAASQLPFLYLMSLKCLNPYVWAFRSSHEQVNRLHRAYGWVIYTMLGLHAAFYLNYFIRVGTLGRRIFSPVVFMGVVAFACMSLLSTTALRRVRTFSYRLFFIVHLLAAFTIPPLLFFHAKSARFFAGEALIILTADLITRRLDTFVSQATLESIPGTDLVKISAPVPSRKANKFRAHPGSHIYLTIPPEARQSSNPLSLSYLLFEFLLNPFTVAAVDEDSGGLTLVARRMGGPMSAALARLTSRQAAVDPSSQRKIPIGIEGPYGMAKRFPSLVSGEFSRILLVAGGIGATFTVPLYRSILQELPNAKVEMVWAVRGAADATWAVTGPSGASGEGGILNDDNVHIFLTGDILDPRAGGSDRDIEMSSVRQSRSSRNRKRPDLKKLVDDVFKHGAEERVAILVCGPDGMAKELREHVGAWVMKGRSIWFHSEGFGL